MCKRGCIRYFYRIITGIVADLDGGNVTQGGRLCGQRRGRSNPTRLCTYNGKALMGVHQRHGSLSEFNAFLNNLDERSIFYRLGKIRLGSIMVEVAVPGQRWEVEFMDDGSVEIEKFISDGGYYNAVELEALFRDFSD